MDTVYDDQGNESQGYIFNMAFVTKLVDYDGEFVDDFDIFFNLTAESSDLADCSPEAFTAGNYQYDDGTWCDNYDYCSYGYSADVLGNPCPEDECKTASIYADERS
jgi:hypothetical protein